jgi:hypothetical protein
MSNQLHLQLIQIKTVKAHGREQEGKGIMFRTAVPKRGLITDVSYKDITSAASILNQIITTYSKQHWNAPKRALRYLKGIRNQC